ncbi:hypothetical protein G3O08_19330 [Cryomorpha ignava]|uniref:Uncharacterized protein n=1 Tax=Cryomorpha ignava TaxID=101383 RepID=A0A7K3WVG7_9FLAO|nr:hypothetical protein [Cryomorpha ignava]NEN25650.1 hypothetical protein [Cryomorpha ignava]
MKHLSNYKTPLVLLCILFLYACRSETPVPKPVGYFRIDLPTPKYQHKSPDCPFEFDISEYSQLELIVGTAHPCWFNVAYPMINNIKYFTYKDDEGKKPLVNLYKI